MTEPLDPEQQQQLDFLRRLFGIGTGEKVVCGDPELLGKTPQEIYQEEMRRLHQGGADYSGRGLIRRAIQRVSRGVRG